MRTNLDDDLARTFRAAAQAAPGPEPDFPAAVAARRRRRARTRMAGMTAVVAVAAAVATLGLNAVRQPDPARPVAAGSRTTVDLSAAKPYRDVWAHALVVLPYPLPDGRRYAVVAALGADSYLVEPWSDRGPLLPVVLNARTGAVRELGTVPASGYKEYNQAGVGVTEHHIFWVVAAVEKGGASYRELWSAPRDGGAPVRRARFGPDHFVLVSAAEVGGVFYAGVGPFNGPGAIYRIPAGGNPQKVPGSDGYALQDGPWAVRQPARPVSLDDLKRATHMQKAPPNLWNVATGERRTPRTLDGVALIGCSPLVCLGHTADSFVSYGADGSRPLRATGVTVDRAGGDDAFFDSTGRFVQIRLGSSDGVYLWDRRTNTVGRQQENQAAMGGDLIDLGQSGDKQRLLDLTRIP